jgi:DegV family protein with EDD domain
MVLDMLDRQNEGYDIEALRQYGENEKTKFTHLFTVDTLNYLYQGGRVSKASFIIADFLKIKPILHVSNDGHLVPLEKAFGRKTSLVKLAARTKALIINPEKQDIFVSHADCRDEAEQLAEQVKKLIPAIRSIIIADIDMVIGAHAGPGTLAVFFKGKAR